MIQKLLKKYGLNRLNYGLNGNIWYFTISIENHTCQSSRSINEFPTEELFLKELEKAIKFTCYHNGPEKRSLVRCSSNCHWCHCDSCGGDNCNLNSNLFNCIKRCLNSNCL